MMDIYKNHYTETLPYDQGPKGKTLKELIDKGIILCAYGDGDKKIMTLVYTHVIKEQTMREHK
ncbi:MAG: hypothetical protein LBL21_01045 [Rickettsiales bacterium]|jgi:hypothetical protein|nr:hypothetical protein [Rickettsiales bacterium]